ncbi:hypothetical protein BASA50_000052 [Batrachochytrium salamandrivorans]|uniref:ubiquitinyl hydrolase 1 n=1 Tax=Batrachochytrium salamandrivorans TaxID=1357716 RepID=A0ABQ8EV10_9FUNG|nr:hypothetical protein BASA62_007010 [Batrachochytrium salamandrivorans]KAH6587005.1 hypothetical protein BASA50_000052 [Batrachochytrium salamandrivorans]
MVETVSLVNHTPCIDSNSHGDKSTPTYITDTTDTTAGTITTTTTDTDTTTGITTTTDTTDSELLQPRTSSIAVLSHKRTAYDSISPHCKQPSPLIRAGVLESSGSTTTSSSSSGGSSASTALSCTTTVKGHPISIQNIIAPIVSSQSHQTSDSLLCMPLSSARPDLIEKNGITAEDSLVPPVVVTSPIATTTTDDDTAIGNTTIGNTLLSIHSESSVQSLLPTGDVVCTTTSSAQATQALVVLGFQPPSTSVSLSMMDTDRDYDCTKDLDDDTSKNTRNIMANNSLVIRPFGSTGLQNLGNTCFMNSALQCLSHTVPLTAYFLSGQWKNELNTTNPLGMEGRIPTVYAHLIHHLWRTGQDRPKSYSPREFKYTIGERNSTFQGYGQQDSHELLQSLLDGLHEDLNRIQKKEFVQDPEMNEMTEAEFANVSWDAYSKRNDSIIVDLFQAQLKNRTICQICSNVSIKFDPYMYLQVPIPEPQTIFVEITVLSHSLPNASLQSLVPKVVILMIPKASTIRDLKLHAAKLLGWSEQAQSDPAYSMVVDVFQSKVYKVFADSHPASEFSHSDKICITELADPTIDFGLIDHYDTSAPPSLSVQVKTSLALFPTDSSQDNSYRHSSSKCFGNPFAIAVPAHIPLEVPTDSRLVSRQIGIIIYRQAVRSLSRYSTIPLFRRVGSNADLQNATSLSTSVSQNIVPDSVSDSPPLLLASSTHMKQSYGHSAETLNDEDTLPEDESITDAVSVNISTAIQSINSSIDASIDRDPLSPRVRADQHVHHQDLSMIDLGEGWEPLPNLFRVTVKQPEPTHSYNYRYSHGKPTLLYPLAMPDVIMKEAGLSVVEKSAISLNDSDPIHEHSHDSSMADISSSLVPMSATSIDTGDIDHQGPLSPNSEGSDLARDVLNSASITLKPSAVNHSLGSLTTSATTADGLSSNEWCSSYTFSPKTEFILEFENDTAVHLFGEQSIYGQYRPASLSSTQSSTSVFEPVVDEASANSAYKVKMEMKQSKATLYTCLEEFSREEILDGDDTMYCSKCKEHRPISKKLDIYSVPEILVIHLKRFSNGGRHGSHRNKIDIMVDAPMRGLDMSEIVGCGSTLAPDDCLYDLYAVSNHFGGLGGGHYTAYVKNPLNDTWYDCNDSSVSPIHSEKIITEAAYLLLYARRSMPTVKLVPLIYEASERMRKQEQEDEEEEERRRQRDRFTSSAYVSAQPLHSALAHHEISKGLAELESTQREGGDDIGVLSRPGTHMEGSPIYSEVEDVDEDEGRGRGDRSEIWPRSISSSGSLDANTSDNNNDDDEDHRTSICSSRPDERLDFQGQLGAGMDVPSQTSGLFQLDDINDHDVDAVHIPQHRAAGFEFKPIVAMDGRPYNNEGGDDDVMDSVPRSPY